VTAGARPVLAENDTVVAAKAHALVISDGSSSSTIDPVKVWRADTAKPRRPKHPSKSGDRSRVLYFGGRGVVPHDAGAMWHRPKR